MQKREKIIVIITIIAALYGVVDFWLSHRPATAVSRSPVIDRQLNAKLAAVNSPDNKRLRELAALINQPWRRIFARHQLDKKTAASDQKGQDIRQQLSVQVKGLHYTGYLEMGNKKIAIINQHDYLTGDKIDGFMLQEISPAMIRLAKDNFTFKLTSQSLPATSKYSKTGADK